MSCINKNLSEYQSLSKTFGDDLSEAFVRGYSKNVKHLEEEFYIPSVKEVKQWLTKEKSEIPKNITRALEIDPNLSLKGIMTLLKGVIHSHEGTIYLTIGEINKPLINKPEVRDMFHDANLAVMNVLQDKFPSIFKIIPTTKRYVKVIEITPNTSAQRELFQGEQILHGEINKTPFTPVERMQILTTFAKKYKMTETQALNYINEALLIDNKTTISLLKTCYA